MVTRRLPSGLIASTSANISPPLDDLAACCGWPLLLEAGPRQLAHELSHHEPEFVLFWLEDRLGLLPTARLVAWARERGPRPYRVAVALQLDFDAEAALRAAGAHSFFSISNWRGADLFDVLSPLWQHAARPAAETLVGPELWTTAAGRAEASATPTIPARPP
jgi:hypothetical protein